MRLYFLGTIIIPTLVSLVARAGPPLITDDPDTLEKGKYELNTLYELEMSHLSPGGRSWAHNTPNFDLAYGWREGVQLKFEVPFVILDQSDRVGTRAGLGDLSLGSKIRLLDEKHAPLSLSIYPAIGLPTGTRSQSLGSGSPSIVLPVMIGKHLMEDKLFLYADGGYEEQFANGPLDRWYAGGAVEYEIRDGLTLIAEVHVDISVRGSGNDQVFNVGFKKELSSYASFIAAFGRSFRPTADSGADFLMNVGIQWSF